MIDRIWKHLNGWKARFLSKGGKLTLIKASLASIPIHYLSPGFTDIGWIDVGKNSNGFLMVKRGRWERYAFGVVGEGMHS